MELRSRGVKLVVESDDGAVEQAAASSCGLTVVGLRGVEGRGGEMVVVCSKIAESEVRIW